MKRFSMGTSDNNELSIKSRSTEDRGKPTGRLRIRKNNDPAPAPSATDSGAMPSRIVLTTGALLAGWSSWALCLGRTGQRRPTKRGLNLNNLVYSYKMYSRRFTARTTSFATEFVIIPIADCSTVRAAVNYNRFLLALCWPNPGHGSLEWDKILLPSIRYVTSVCLGSLV